MKGLQQGCLVTALIAATAATTTRADIRVQVAESVNNAEPVTVTHWFGPDRSMRDDGDRYIITRLDQARTYVVDRATERYRVVEMTLDQNNNPKVSIKATEDRRTINGWSTRRYRVSGKATGDLTIDVWTTNAIDADLTGFRKLMVRLGNRSGSEWMKAYRDIPGFPILQTVTLERPGIRLTSRSKVVDVARVEPGPNTYSPPGDYERVRSLQGQTDK